MRTSARCWSRSADEDRSRRRAARPARRLRDRRRPAERGPVELAVRHPVQSTTIEPDASDTKACAEVRAGIDDFNLGDFQGTVAHFRAAVPLARDQAREESSAAADDLLEAVTYYAELAPADYPSASATSPDFATYKEITLGQCVAPGAEPEQDPSDSPGTST